MKLTIPEILKACNGTLLSGDENTVVTFIHNDSRLIKPGALFVPIPGEHANAHNFIPMAFENGAVATLTQEHTQSTDEKHVWIQVENTHVALHQLAAYYRSKFEVPLIGVTGSVGKTTTREMIALALSAERNVMKTEGNENSQVGLPLTMFQFTPEHTAAVIEMGMSEFGEMEKLAQIARPDYAVVTNIGIAHIQQLKSRENILSEKLHIADYFSAKSKIFVNGDDEILASMKNTTTLPVIYYGTKPWCNYRAENISTKDISTSFTIVTPKEEKQVTLPVLGIHNVQNCLAAVAVAEELGLCLNGVIAKLATYVPPSMRQTLYHTKNGITIMDDTYNASPDSVKSGVDVICQLPNVTEKVVVLADMLELGDYSEWAHFEVGEYVAKAGVDRVITIGEKAKKIAEGAVSVKPTIITKVCENNEEAIIYLKEVLQKGSAVMMKGAHSMHVSEIVHALIAYYGV